MTMRLYVGNIPFSATEQDLWACFERCGQVFQVAIVTDRETGRNRGFAFVEMDDEGGSRAIEELDNTDLGGRPLAVSKAREKEQRMKRPNGAHQSSGRNRDW